MKKREIKKELVFLLAFALILVMFSLLISADSFGGSIDLNLTINETGNSSINNSNTISFLCLNKGQIVKFSECNSLIRDKKCNSIFGCKVCVSSPRTGVYCPENINKCNTVNLSCIYLNNITNTTNGGTNTTGNQTNNQTNTGTNTTNVSYSGTIAYLTKKKANPSIVNAFNEMNLDVKVIRDKELSSGKLNGYDTIFIDNTVLKNIKKINLREYKVISINRIYGEELGLTDGDGLSQRSSNGKLKVNKEGSVITVYSQQFVSSEKVGIPYYYISNNNKVKNSNITYAASVYNGNQYIGNVIAYSKLGKGVCFFGISQAKYWTSDSKELFKDCIRFTYSNLNETQG